MKEEIVVNKVSIKEKRIEILFDVTVGLKPYFNSTQRVFWLDYSEDISKVPVSLAVVPFVCNVLPILWLTDAKLSIQELDKTFFDSIPIFEQGYINMYPMLEFKGSVEPQKIVDNHYGTDGGNAAFFSGGVDAFTTLVCHRSEIPLLITLRGSDIKLDDIEGWDNVYKHLQETVNLFKLPIPICVTSNFRTFINEGTLSKLVVNSNDGWWHGFQCGIGLIAQAAPIAYLKHIKVVYIASSYTLNDKIPSASYPTIDNYVRFGETQVVHDQYEHHRQEKMQILIKYHKETTNKLNLRVCWISRGGKNCCHCEKCLRTIFALMAEGESPRDYGFYYTEEDILNSKNVVVESLYNTNDGVRADWIHVKERFNETGAYKDDPRINWVYTLDPYAKKPSPPKPSLLTRIVRKIRRTLKS